MLACGTFSSPTQSPPPASETTTDETLSAGDSYRTLLFDGLERTYILHIPPGLDASHPVPLVLAFHGIGLDGNEMIRISGFNAQADASGFIVVYPEGTGNKKSWNGGHCCGEAMLNNVDDVGFVQALLEELSTIIPLDRSRVYATGFSNGAIMVYRLACELADRIAAIGAVSATQAAEDLPTCQPARPVPVIHFHGTDDDANPYNGGETAIGAHFLAVPDAMQFWTEQDSCPAQSQQTISGSIIHDTYEPCQSGATVELYTIEGGKHAWPGGEAVNQQMGEPTTEISATPIMWEFFSSHPMP